MTTLNVNHRGEMVDEERPNVLRCRADILGTKGDVGGCSPAYLSSVIV